MEAVCSCLRSYKRAVEFSTVVLMDVDSVVGDGLQAWGCVRVCVCVVSPGLLPALFTAIIGLIAL